MGHQTLSSDDILRRRVRKRARRAAFALLAITAASYAARAYHRHAPGLDFDAIKAVPVAADISLLDERGIGREILKECREERAVVLVALGSDETSLRLFANEARTLAHRFETRGARIWGLSGDPKATPESIRKTTEQEGSPSVLLDPRHELLDDLGMSRSLETVVLDEGGQLLARGDRRFGQGARKRLERPGNRRNVRPRVRPDFARSVAPGRSVGRDHFRRPGCADRLETLRFVPPTGRSRPVFTFKLCKRCEASDISSRSR